MESTISHLKTITPCLIVNVAVLALVSIPFFVSTHQDDLYRNLKTHLQEATQNSRVNFHEEYSLSWKSTDNETPGSRANGDFESIISLTRTKRETEIKDANDMNHGSSKGLTAASHGRTEHPPTVEQSRPKQPFSPISELSHQDATKESSWDYVFTGPYENADSRGPKRNKDDRSKVRLKSQEHFNRNSDAQNLSLADHASGISLTTSLEQAQWSNNEDGHGSVPPMTQQATLSAVSLGDKVVDSTETQQSTLKGSSPTQSSTNAGQNAGMKLASPWHFDGQVNKNSLDLVDTKRQNTVFSWFRSMSNNTLPFLTPTEVPVVQGVTSNRSTFENTVEMTTSISTYSSSLKPRFEICNKDCEKNGGTCVMGNDFRPHCIIVAPDACDHFHCANGECVSDDGVYTCECGQGWAGTFCDVPCPLDCGQHGYCSVLGRRGTPAVTAFDKNRNERQEVSSNTTNTSIAADVVCICHWNHTGANWLQVPRSEFHAWQVALISILCAVTVALLCFLASYILWRRSWLPMRKLVYYFQEYEDDDDKDFDAFVSYKSSPRDEIFVLRHLYPKLEQELGFKLCLHFRDFPPGEAIANNIIQAVERSRRTILVLSPNYVSSEWCRLEYQKAQHEMLKLKHKIIPVILEDVRKVPEMDKALRTIIDTVTYVEWPGEPNTSFPRNFDKVIDASTTKDTDHDRFWKLLACSMPKKRKEICSEKGVRRVSNTLALTVVSGPATSTAASLIPHLASPMSHSNSVVSLSSMEDIHGNGSKIREIRNEDVGSAQKLSYEKTCKLFGNNCRNLREMGNNTRPNSVSITSSAVPSQVQHERLATPERRVSLSCRRKVSASFEETKDSHFSSKDNSLTVYKDSKTLMLNKPISDQQNPFQLILLTTHHPQEENMQNGTQFQGASSNMLTAHTDENDSYLNMDADNTIQTKIDLLASKCPPDSGIESLGDGSFCSSTRSSIKESRKSQRSAPHDVKTASKDNPLDVRKHKSSDDYIMEIRNIEDRTIVTPRPRTLINYNYLDV
ncbi:hypothetical protein EGW08_016520 [Elysia chlorotica]|uniref:TIR domain-containing protein n=1 Tax=Elysia chlorotica TaxID=188477 RepID=A0A433T2C2_ELYCH|nr:hypothetical protein EGW08_016520 [Elysia chlorotica]